MVMISRGVEEQKKKKNKILRQKREKRHKVKLFLLREQRQGGFTPQRVKKWKEKVLMG